MTWDELVAAARAAQSARMRPTVSSRWGAALVSDGQVFRWMQRGERQHRRHGLRRASTPSPPWSLRGNGATSRLVVVTPAQEPKTPCGLCRQVLAEFHHHGDFEILCVGTSGEELRIHFSELHPHGFGPKDLLEEPSD